MMQDDRDIAEEAEDAAMAADALAEYRREGGMSAADFFADEASAGKVEDSPDRSG